MTSQLNYPAHLFVSILESPRFFFARLPCRGATATGHAMNGPEMGAETVYEISVDRTLRLVHVRILGVMSPDIAATYERNLKWEIENLCRIRSGFSILVDLREAPVTSKNDTERIQNRMRWYISYDLRKAAYIVESTIHQLQVRRLAIDDRFNCFTSEEDAMAWLRS